MRITRLTAAALLLLATVGAAGRVVVEDWSEQPVGHTGIPVGWQGQNWGSPAYAFTIEDHEGQRVLHLKSHDEGSTISTDIKGKVNLKETPILEWTWKAVTLPRGGNACHKATDDEVGQLYVTWPRFPEALRSRIIGYIWDTTAPVDTICKSEKTGTVTYVVVRAGPSDLGRWITEHRNVREDFKKIYGEEPESPAAISLAIDSNDTHSTAEAYVGAIFFRPP